MSEGRPAVLVMGDVMLDIIAAPERGERIERCLRAGVRAGSSAVLRTASFAMDGFGTDGT